MASVADIAKKREALIKAYASESWRQKVNKMPPDQVIAVYLRFKNQNKL